MQAHQGSRDQEEMLEKMVYQVHKALQDPPDLMEIVEHLG